MRIILALLITTLSASPVLAVSDQYGRAVTCSGAGPVVCSSGALTVTAPTEQSAIATFNAMAPGTWVPPAPPPQTTISAYDFINRLTPAEQTAIQAARPMWPIQIASLGTVDVTNGTLLADIQAAVAAGLLTQARAAQILDLRVPSP